MDFEKKQNRREFLKSIGRNVTLGGLTLIGVSAGVGNLFGSKKAVCEVNLPCRNCFKLGSCKEDKAVEMRNEIKAQTRSDKPVGERNGK